MATDRTRLVDRNIPYNLKKDDYEQDRLSGHLLGNSCSFGLRYVSWYKYLIVSLVFSHLGFWSGNLFLIAPFPDLCLLVPFYYK